MADVLHPEVAARFRAAPKPVCDALKAARRSILKVARQFDVPVEETTRWGQPAYVPARKKDGTTIRIDHNEDDKWCVYVHCQTTLVGQFKARFPDWQYEGNRAIVFDADNPPEPHEMETIAELALTYHRRRTARQA